MFMIKADFQKVLILLIFFNLKKKICPMNDSRVKFSIFLRTVFVVFSLRGGFFLVFVFFKFVNLEDKN